MDSGYVYVCKVCVVIFACLCAHVFLCERKTACVLGLRCVSPSYEGSTTTKGTKLAGVYSS